MSNSNYELVSLQKLLDLMSFIHLAWDCFQSQPSTHGQPAHFPQNCALRWIAPHLGIFGEFWALLIGGFLNVTPYYDYWMIVRFLYCLLTN